MSGNVTVHVLVRNEAVYDMCYVSVNLVLKFGSSDSVEESKERTPSKSV